MVPVTKMQKPSSCSTEQEAVTLKDVLYNDGAASVMIQFLKLKAKRNLRLVCHAGKDAVDKTVTAVYRSSAQLSFSILANAKWKGVNELNMGGWGAKHDEIIQIAEAGFSKLESLAFYTEQHYSEVTARKMIDAGWKLKKLKIGRWVGLRGFYPAWFDILMRDANWPLESLSIKHCIDGVTDIIGKSNLPLKHLCLGDSELSLEAVEQLMKGSWVATIESLDLSISRMDSKGTRALTEGLCRAVNLQNLNIYYTELANEDALILAKGSYPNLKRLYIKLSKIEISGFTAILKSCPVLEALYNNWPLKEPLEDAEDVKIVAEHMRLFTHLDLRLFNMSPAVSCSLLAHEWSKVEYLIIGLHKKEGDRDITNEVIAALVQHDWPCLRTLTIQAANFDIDDEGSRMLSAKQWPPTLEELYLRTPCSNTTCIKLDSDKLPGLKTLKFSSNRAIIASSVLEQTWPHLETLSLQGQESTYLSLGPDTWVLEVLTKINRSYMPNLKVLMLRGAFESTITLFEEMAERMGFETVCERHWYDEDSDLTDEEDSESDDC